MSVNRIIIKQDTVGGRIKKYRLEKGLTQKELAQKCGMFDSAIRRYELGTQNPKKETIERIATALEIPSTALLLPDAPTKEMIETAISNAVAGVGKSSASVSTSSSAVDIDKIVDRVSTSLFAGASAIPKDFLQSIYFNDQPDKPVEEMSPCEIADAISATRKAFEDFYNTLKPSFSKLNSEGRAEAIKRVEELTQIPKYTTPDDTDKEET